MKARKAITLVEVMVAIGLLSCVLVLVLSLLPAGVLSMKQAENIQMATKFAQRLVEEAPVPSLLPTTDSSLVYQANGTLFRATRTLLEAQLAGGNARCYDIHVIVTWTGCQVPVEVHLRKQKAL